MVGGRLAARPMRICAWIVGNFRASQWTHWRLTAARGDPTVRAAENSPADGSALSNCTGDGWNGGARDHRLKSDSLSAGNPQWKQRQAAGRQSTPRVRG